MLRLSIARSLRWALVVLTLVLAAVAVVGVASLYDARQSYENVLQRSTQRSVAAANVATAQIAAGRAPDSRRALVLMGIAGALALLGAIALVPPSCVR